MPPLQIQRHTETRESSREEPHCDPTDRHNHHLTRPNPTTLPHARAVISISSPSLPSLWTLRHELPPHASHLRATAGHRHTDTATAYLRCSLSVLVLSLCFFLSSSPAGVSLFSLLRSDARRRRVLAASLARVARAPPRAFGAPATHPPQPCPPPDSGTLGRATCARCSLCSPPQGRSAVCLSSRTPNSPSRFRADISIEISRLPRSASSGTNQPHRIFIRRNAYNNSSIIFESAHSHSPSK